MPESGDLPQPPPPEVFVGPDERRHLMRFSLSQGVAGVVAVAEEEQPESDPGYRFEVVADAEDASDLFDQLRDTVEDGIGTLWLARDSQSSSWRLRSDQVDGRLLAVEPGQAPELVVDGIRLSWEELGRIVSAEAGAGIQFSLLLGQGPAHLDSDALFDDEEAEQDALQLLRE